MLERAVPYESVQSGDVDQDDDDESNSKGNKHRRNRSGSGPAHATPRRPSSRTPTPTLTPTPDPQSPVRVTGEGEAGGEGASGAPAVGADDGLSASKNSEEFLELSKKMGYKQRKASLIDEVRLWACGVLGSFCMGAGVWVAMLTHATHSHTHTHTGCRGPEDDRV